jgi:hypothetical protein
MLLKLEAELDGRVTVSGFSRYPNPVASPPASEQKRAFGQIVSQLPPYEQARS